MGTSWEPDTRRAQARIEKQILREQEREARLEKRFREEQTHWKKEQDELDAKLRVYIMGPNEAQGPRESPKENMKEPSVYSLGTLKLGSPEGVSGEARARLERARKDNRPVWKKASRLGKPFRRNLWPMKRSTYQEVVTYVVGYLVLLQWPGVALEGSVRHVLSTCDGVAQPNVLRSPQ